MSSKVSVDSASVGLDCAVCGIKMLADAFTFPSSLISLQWIFNVSSLNVHCKVES